MPFLLRIARSQSRTGEELEALFSQTEAWAKEFAARSLDELSDQGLFDEFMVWMERVKRSITPQFVMTGIALTSFALLERQMDRWFGRKQLAQAMITGLSDIYAAEMGPALWEIAKTVRQVGLTEVVLENDPSEALTRLQGMPSARPIIESLDLFLQHYGHRCPNEGEWLLPRWADAPEQVIGMLANYLRGGDEINPTETRVRQAKQLEETTNWTLDHLGIVRRAILRRILSRAQSSVRLRDNGKHHYLKLLFSIRRIAMTFGQRWTSRGWLEQAEDVFFLTLPDVQQLIKTGDAAVADLCLSVLVAERRKSYRHWFEVDVPEIIGSDGQPIEADVPNQPMGDVLQGIPASGGRVQGTAYIVHNPREAGQLHRGRIMVARAADPGWTPLFPLAAGLVLEVGGQLSHAVIVARELGLPTVVNIANATKRIRDGQTITIDGTTGHVYLHESDTN